LFKAAPPQSCSEQLLSLPRKVVSESGFPKLLSKAIPQSYRFSKQLSVNAAFKAAKLLPAVAPQSCSSKLLPKAASQRSSPKLQSCSPQLPQSWSGERFGARRNAEKSTICRTMKRRKEHDSAQDETQKTDENSTIFGARRNFEKRTIWCALHGHCFTKPELHYDDVCDE
jgi:hypothetical protein